MKQRDSARALILNEHKQILLLRCVDQTPVDPANPGILDYWVTPGGGVERGESFEEALRRELLEELGLDGVEVRALVAERKVVLDLPEKGLVLNYERYFACRLHGDVALNHQGLSQLEKQVFRSAQWWDLGELAQSSVVLRPQRLIDLCRAALAPDDACRIYLDA